MENTQMSSAKRSEFKDIIFIEDLLFNTEELNFKLEAVNTVGTKRDIEFIEDFVYHSNELDEVIAAYELESKSSHAEITQVSPTIKSKGNKPR